MLKQTTRTEQTGSGLARQLFSMTWPMVFGVLSMMSFQLIDSIFISQLGVLPLAAQGFTLPVQMIVIGLQVGLGIATTAVIGRVSGQGNAQYAKQLGGLILVIGSVSVAVLAVMIFLIRDPLLHFLGASEDIFPIIDLYWPYWLVSAWSGATLYFLYSICRANGNTILPGSMMVVTSLLNLVFDPLFIFSMDLGLPGAALATLASFALGGLIVTIRIWPKRLLSFIWQGMDIPVSIRMILQVMGPATVSQLLPPLSAMTATKIIAAYGSAPVAAWAIGSRFEFFSLVVVLALTMAMPPMVARFLGGKKVAEIRQLMRIAVCFILSFQAGLAIISFGLSFFAVNWMSDDPAVRQLLRWHLTYVPVSLAPLGVCMLVVSVANALGRSYTALTISALRLFVFFLPCLWIGAQLLQLKGIYMGALVGNCLAGAGAWVMYRRMIHQTEKQNNQG
ncbi:MATE family efflux transporter [Vibrio aerogenes]|nr:MATE family efflux transporter [Vibrio aerogenes]